MRRHSDETSLKSTLLLVGVSCIRPTMSIYGGLDDDEKKLGDEEKVGKGEEDKVDLSEETEDKVEPAPSDDEDDCEGYFLEPVSESVNIAEKIAEANKKLMEEEEGDEDRPRKVQFSEELVNFEPTYSDDECTESARNSIISEEDVELKLNLDESCDNQSEVDADDANVIEEKLENEPEEEIAEELDLAGLGETNSEELPVDDLQEGSKLLLVLLPKEHNSSCESIIGEEIPEEKPPETEEVMKQMKGGKAKMARPKSAKKSCCEVPKISPNLTYTLTAERKPWQGCLKTKPKKKQTMGDKSEGHSKDGDKEKAVKKITINNLSLDGSRRGEELRRCCDNRPKSCRDRREVGFGENRPKTAPMRRTCCVIKTELPRYNGLRSEYGLSEEQLQERKRKTTEIKHQKHMDKLKERREELRKRNENEEVFQKWLLKKSQKVTNKKPIRLTDTLARSDVYIQSHASYAANRRVPYSVDYTLTKKINYRKSHGKISKTIILDKLLDKVSPHFKRSFNIYLGVRP